MTEFSVGDRVLVPGVVTAGLRDGVNVRLVSEGDEIVHLTVDDLRPDTGGRDLTAQDVNNALNAYDNGQDTRTIAADLNRIARGDRPSGAGDMAPPAERRRNGFPDSIWPSPPAAGPRAGDTAATSLGAAGSNLEDRAGDDTAPPGTCLSDPDGQHRWGGGRASNECDDCDALRPVSTTGPRAGDGTAPDDAVREWLDGPYRRLLDENRRLRSQAVADDEVIATLKSAYDHACADWRQRADELVAERDAARSEAAELRAAGDELAAAADQVTDGVLSWPHVEGSLIRAREVWRSAAGSPATDETGDGHG